VCERERKYETREREGKRAEERKRENKKKGRETS